MTTGIALHKDWVCAKGCGAGARTYSDRLPHHRCKLMGGLMVGLIPVGQKAKVEAIERQDYVGDDLVDYTDGKVIMSTVITRDDGQDCTVYAPCATATVEKGELRHD
jgi:hypothetical protein